MATTTAAVVAKPRVNGSGSKIPLPPSALQRARHTPAVASTVAVRHTSNVTKPSRLPVRSVAPARAPNSTGVSAQAPRNGKVSAPVKPAAVKSPNSLPKPKPATSRVAASSGRQTKSTSSVRALPPASEPTAKPKSSAKPVVTKATASKPRVVLPPPKKQPAPVAPRTTKSVLASAKSMLPRPSKVQKQPAQTKTRLPLPPVKPTPVEDDFMATIDAGLKEAKANARMEECVYHPEPYFGRDPFLHSARTDLGDGESYQVLCRKARDPLHHLYDEKHVRPLYPVPDSMRKKFFSPCSSSRKIENRSSAAPKAKTVRFAGIDDSRYRCIPACLQDPVYFKGHGESTLFWEPSEAEVKRFRQFTAARAVEIQARVDRTLAKA